MKTKAEIRERKVKLATLNESKREVRKIKRNSKIFYIKKCVLCNTQFECKRIDALSCSKKCRQTTGSYLRSDYKFSIENEPKKKP